MWGFRVLIYFGFSCSGTLGLRALWIIQDLGLGSSGHRQEHDVPMGIGHSAAAPPAGMNCSAASSSSSAPVATSPFMAGSSADVGSSLVATSPSLVATSPSLAGPPPPLPPPPQAPPQSAKPLGSVFSGQYFVLWLTGISPRSKWQRRSGEKPTRTTSEQPCSSECPRREPPSRSITSVRWAFDSWLGGQPPARTQSPSSRTCLLDVPRPLKISVC